MTPSLSRALPFYIKLGLILVSLLSLCFIAVEAKEILSPLFFALLFSLALLPLVNFFERRLRFPGGAAAGVSVILLLTALVSLLYFLGSRITNLAQDWPQFQQQIDETIQNLHHWIHNTMNIGVKQQMKYVNKATSQVLSSTSTIISATFLSLTSVLLFVVFTMIYTFFLLLYRRLILKFLIAVFKEENSDTVYDIVEEVQYIVRKYIFGLLLEMLIVSTVCCVTFLILGIKYAILLGLITGIFNLIPYIGIFTSLVLSTFITFATGASDTKILLVVITYIVVHLTDSNFLLPVIVGSKVRINALITVIGVIAGEMIWGIAGMFLSIPIIAISKIIFDRIETLKPWGLLLGDKEADRNHKGKRKIIAEAEQDKPKE